MQTTQSTGDVRRSRYIARTASVALREWSLDDGVWYARLVGDPQVMRYVGDGKPRTAATAGSEITAFQTESTARGWSRWAVEFNDGEPGGLVGFSVRNGKVDWGARFFPKFWQKTLLPIAGILGLNTGLIGHEIPSATAYTHIDNKSAWQFNTRMGFIEIGRVNLVTGIHIVQTITRSAYMQDQQHIRNQALLQRCLHRVQRDQLLS